MKKVLLIGDVHAAFDDMEQLCRRHMVDEVWQLGDLGFHPWLPKIRPFAVNRLPPFLEL